MNEGFKRVIRELLPRSLKPHSINSGPLRGARIVTSWHDYPAAILGRTERPLLQWFINNVSTGETWLDIGAHYGYTAIALSKLVGPSGRVFAFEPMIASAGCISRTRNLNQLTQLTVIPAALSNCVDIGIDSLRTVRGMIDSTLNGSARLSEPFIVASLDWLWPRIAGPNVRLHGVKVDVQGMEIAVLEGMANLARQFAPTLIVEVHEGVPRSKLIHVLSELGYNAPGIPIEPQPGETTPAYFNDRSYLFLAK
jgi:FkbM family methyltransferase